MDKNLKVEHRQFSDLFLTQLLTFSVLQVMSEKFNIPKFSRLGINISACVAGLVNKTKVIVYKECTKTFHLSLIQSPISLRITVMALL